MPGNGVRHSTLGIKHALAHTTTAKCLRVRNVAKSSRQRDRSASTSVRSILPHAHVNCVAPRTQVSKIWRGTSATCIKPLPVCIVVALSELCPTCKVSAATRVPPRTSNYQTPASCARRTACTRLPARLCAARCT